MISPEQVTRLAQRIAYPAFELLVSRSPMRSQLPPQSPLPELGQLEPGERAHRLCRSSKLIFPFSKSGSGDRARRQAGVRQSDSELQSQCFISLYYLSAHRRQSRYGTNSPPCGLLAAFAIQFASAAKAFSFSVGSASVYAPWGALGSLPNAQCPKRFSVC